MYRNNYTEYEINGNRDKNPWIEEYFNKIKPSLKVIIIILQKSDSNYIQLAIEINFISSKDASKEQTMHSENGNIEVMTYDNPDEIIEELLNSLLSRYQIGLKTCMRASGFYLWLR